MPSLSVPLRQLKTDQKRILELNDKEVELDEEKGQPKRIRPVGESWLGTATPPPRPEARRLDPHTAHGSRGGAAQGARGRQGERDEPRGELPQPAFHNPYNFVPAPPRTNVTGDLGDGEPVGHHRYLPDRISGVIRVKLTTETPLLLPDAARGIEYQEEVPALGITTGHKAFPVRVDADQKPYLPSTSIKGMLRAAYEAVTNSRLAVFAGHKDRLADRMPARDGLALVPARIVSVNGTESIELLPGDSGISGSGLPADNDPMYAAWLPRYERQTGQVAQFAVRYPDNGLPKHREAVEVWLELWKRTGQFPFAYWSVRKCVRAGQALGAQPQPGKPRGAHRPVAGVSMIHIPGHVCVTNRNIDRKHDERVFFTTRPAPMYHPLTEELRRQWRELIANYQTIHTAEIEADMACPPALNNSVWSRQIKGGSDELQLTEGAMCYAAFQEGSVTELYPVMICAGFSRPPHCRCSLTHSNRRLTFPNYPLPTAFLAGSVRLARVPTAVTSAWGR